MHLMYDTQDASTHLFFFLSFIRRLSETCEMPDQADFADIDACV
jgi:hypothetical protein